jgi:ankyrin repeat protein
MSAAEAPKVPLKPRKICSVADTCDYCGQYSTTKKCSGCKEARYCTPACQKSHWPDHKLLCRQIQAERNKKARRRELGEKLYVASAYGQVSSLRSLVAAGADPRYKLEEEGEFKGYFPLLMASHKGFLEVMQALLDVKADPNQVGGELSFSSLHQAAGQNQPNAIALLARSGANVNLADTRGGTPLFVAADQGSKEAVIALLVAKAAVNQAKNNGVGPVFIAAQHGHSDILKLLIKAGGDVNQVRVGNASPLMVASIQRHVECVKILLASGANALHKTDDGDTALDFAIYKKHTAVEAVLRAHLEAKSEAEAEANL